MGYSEAEAVLAYLTNRLSFSSARRGRGLEGSTKGVREGKGGGGEGMLSAWKGGSGRVIVVCSVPPPLLPPSETTTRRRAWRGKASSRPQSRKKSRKGRKDKGTTLSYEKCG